jgi:hypothetical protein
VIGATIAVSELVNDEPASTAQRVTPAATVTVPAEVCTPETDNLLATETALPPTVVNNLSPDLRHFIEASVRFGQSPRYLPAADTMTIGACSLSSIESIATSSWPPFRLSSTPR